MLVNKERLARVRFAAAVDAFSGFQSFLYGSFKSGASYEIADQSCDVCPRAAKNFLLCREEIREPCDCPDYECWCDYEPELSSYRCEFHTPYPKTGLGHLSFDVGRSSSLMERVAIKSRTPVVPTFRHAEDDMFRSVLEALVGSHGQLGNLMHAWREWQDAARATAQEFKPQKRVTFNLVPEIRLLPARDMAEFAETPECLPIELQQIPEPQFDEQVVVKLPTVVNTSVEDLDMANHAESPPRKTRGGRRNYARRPGFCYLKYIPKKRRDHAMLMLGAFPTFTAFSFYMDKFKLEPRNARLVFVHGGMHVYHHPGWPARLQFRILREDNCDRRVGCDDFDTEEVQALLEMTRGVDFIELSQWFDENVVVTQEQVEVERIVAAPGDCWKRIDNILFAWEDDNVVYGKLEGDVTAGMMIEKYQRLYEREGEFITKARVQWEEQEDGDYHVHDFNFPAKLKPWHGKTTTVHEFHMSLVPTKYVGKGAISGVDAAIAAVLAPDVRTAVEKNAQVALIDNLEAARQICPYQVPEALQERMCELKLPWSKVFAKPHDHVVHAAIRRWGLLTEVKKTITMDTTIVGMKPEHFAMLRSVVPDSINLVLRNVVVDPKDIPRYARSGCVDHQVFTVNKVETPAVYFDEQGHYLSAGFIVQFAKDNPNVVNIGYSSIFPLEALEFETSPDPEFCEWTVIPKKSGQEFPTLVYIPEGDVGGKYEQPFDPTPILATRYQSTDGTVSLTGGVIAAKAHYRIHQFYTFNVAPQHCQVVAQYDYVNLPRVFYAQPDCPPIKAASLMQLFLYAKVINSNKEQNLAGKIRLFADERKMYLPPSKIDLIIAVVLLMVETTTVGNMMDKTVSGLGEDIYKKTLGVLVRAWKKVTTVRYAKKNAKLIDYHSPLYIYPMIQARVKLSSDRNFYGLDWSCEVSPPAGFWWKVRHWMKAMWGRVFSEATPVQLDASGKFIFPHIAATTLQLKRFGPDFVRENQAAAFRALFNVLPEQKVEEPAAVEEKPREPNRLPEDDPSGARRRMDIWLGKQKERMKPLLSEQELETITEEEPPPLSRQDTGTTSSSGGTSSSSTTNASTSSSSSATTESSVASSSSGSTLVEEAPDQSLWSEIKKPYEDAVDFLTYVKLTGRMTLKEYHEYCETAEEAKKRRGTALGMTLQAIVERAQTRAGLRVTGVVTDTFDTKQPTMARGPAVLDDPDARRALHLHRNDMSVFNPPTSVKVQKKEKRTYEERKAAFIRLYRNRPATATFNHAASGVTLWDAMYGTSSDRRVSPEPYPNIIEYPDVPYPENDCVLVALGEALGKGAEEIYFIMLRAYPREELHSNHATIPLKMLHPVGLKFNVMLQVRDEDGNLLGNFGMRATEAGAVFQVKDHHMEVVKPLHQLVITRSPFIPRTIRPGAELLPTRLQSWAPVKWKPWVPEQKRANDYVRAIRNGEITVLGEPINMEQLLTWDNLTSQRATFEEKYLCVVMGDPGCRKSSTPQREMRRKDVRQTGNFAIISPSSVLATDWRDKLDAQGSGGNGKLTGQTVVTLDVALAKDVSGHLVVTDEDRFPKGFHALYGYLNPQVKYHLFMCDPWQSQWHNPSPSALNDPDIAGEAQFYMNYASYYIVGTWRFGGIAALFFRMPSFGKQGDSNYVFMDTMPTVHTDLLEHFPHMTEASVAELWQGKAELYAAHFKKVVAGALRQSDAVTFTGSQGLSRKLVIIEVDDNVIQGADSRILYTAMTRAPNIVFVRKWRENGRSEYHVAAHPIFSQLEYYRKRYTPGNQVQFNPEHSVDIREATQQPFPDNLKLVFAGKHEDCNNWRKVQRWWSHLDPTEHFIDPNESRPGARLRRDDPLHEPAFQPFIDETEEFDSEVFPWQEFHPQEPRIQTSIPLGDRAGFIEDHNSQVLERTEAELVVNGQFSMQFQDHYLYRHDQVQQLRNLISQQPGTTRRARYKQAINKLSKMTDDENPLLFKPEAFLWGANQLAKDAVTYAAARMQRIKYTTTLQNQANLATQKDFGLAVFDAFRRYLGWTQPIPWNEIEYQKAIILFQERRGDRSAAERAGSRNRAYMPHDSLAMTIKQQWKLKSNLFEKAKPGQPIMIHSDSYIFEHGPYGIYFLDKFLENKPDYYYLHAKATIADYHAWNARYLAGDEITEMTDLKGQDASTQGWAVVFFEQMLRWMSFPEPFVQEFVRNKLNKTHNDKLLAIMTNSGEIWTYLLNSMSASAAEVFEYGIPPGFPVAGTGDDMRRRTGLTRSPAYLPYRHIDPRIVKRFTSTRGEFISFLSRGPYVFKDPIMLLKRFFGRLESGRAEDAALGYFDLWAWNYNQGEILMQCMTPAEIEAHQIMTRIMFNPKKEGIKRKFDYTKLQADGLATEEQVQMVPYLKSLDFDTAQVHMAPLNQILTTNPFGVRSTAIDMGVYSSLF